MRAALNIALSLGLSPERLREAILQTYLFAGYPRAINALAALAALLPPQKPSPALDLEADRGREREWLDRGQALCRRVYGKAYPRLLDSMAGLSPDLGRWMILEGYGKVLSRPGLDPVTRELAAVAALAVLRVPPQLGAHLRGCLQMGASEEMLRGILALAALLVPEEAAGHRRLLERVLERRR